MMLTSHSVATVVVNSVFPFVSAVFIILRFYARSIKNVTPKIDDYLIVAAFVKLTTRSIKTFAKSA